MSRSTKQLFYFSDRGQRRSRWLCWTDVVSCVSRSLTSETRILKTGQEPPTVSAVVQVLLTYEELRLFFSVSALEDGAESKLFRKFVFPRFCRSQREEFGCKHFASQQIFLRSCLSVLCKILTCLLVLRHEVEVSYSLEVRQSAVLQFFYLSQSEKIKKSLENCWISGKTAGLREHSTQWCFPVFSSAVNLRAEPGFSSWSSLASCEYSLWNPIDLLLPSDCLGGIYLCCCNFSAK